MPQPDHSVSAEMVERGAIALWLTYKSERVSSTSKFTPLAIQQGRYASGWREVAIKEWYRRKARAVLDAALDPAAVDEERHRG